MARSKPPSFDGLVVVDKPAGITSHDAVARCRKIFGQRQVGHAGTLDPAATGVLLIGLGSATRLLRFSSEARKTYVGTVVFGSATSTLDASGEVTQTCEMSPTRVEIERAAASFVGEIQQVPPMVSAIRVGGRRLHELAREGIEVERAPRPVTIHRLVVESVDGCSATVLVDCSSGTYIRSLAADLGVALGGVAHLGTLRRLAVGAFSIDEARPLEAIAEHRDACVLTPAEAVRALPAIRVDAATATVVSHGAAFSCEHDSAGPFAVLDEAGVLLAVYERGASHGLRPVVVLPTAVAR